MEQFIIGGLSVLVAILFAVIVAGFVVLKRTTTALKNLADDFKSHSNDIWQEIRVNDIKSESKHDILRRHLLEVEHEAASNLDSRLDKLEAKLTKR